MATVTALEFQQRNKERVNVYLDGEYAFSLTAIEAARLHKGQILTDIEIKELKNEDEIQRAVDSAARFLAHRPRSEAEVRQNLSKKQFPVTVVDAALEKLRKLGYLDDFAFARYWLENRSAFNPRGPRAIQYELQQKGVSREIVEQVLEGFESYDAAYRAAASKAKRMQGLDQQTFRVKLGSFLQRRGFSFSTNRDVIEQLMNELVEDNPEFFIQDDN